MLTKVNLAVREVNRKFGKRAMNFSIAYP